MAENEELAQQLAAAQLNEGGTNNDVEMESCSGTCDYNLDTVRGPINPRRTLKWPFDGQQTRALLPAVILVLA